MGNGSGKCAPEELLALIQWHIVRCDELRSAVANRAAVLLSANAFTSAGVAAVSVSVSAPQERIFLYLLFVATASTLVFAALSVAFAADSLINRFGWSVRYGVESTPFAPAFSHSDTVRYVGSLADFRQGQLDLRMADALEHAISELWIVIRAHHRRYGQMQKSVRLFYYSLGSFVASSVFALLIRFLVA
ncbi:hypothetical protein ABZ016_12680 [Streptomyces sp. NPDC006372]|uniref:hypothetical protein n=1 Tax=Streptomyces sp. NPDC006372 TaxID=3155599 RepID=UPI0033BE698F